MNKYKWLLWRHNRAMKVFEKAKQNLLSLAASFQSEMVACSDRIRDHEESIRKENEAFTFLSQQRILIEKQHDKIDAVLNPQ